MSLLTVNETKQLLQIDVTTYDQLINTILPMIRDFIVDYTHNQFFTDHYIHAGTIAFVAGTGSTAATITDSESDFVTSYLTNAKDIHVGNSLYNDGYFRVASVAAGTITLAAGEVLNTEAAGTVSPIIHEVDWPNGLKRIAVKMIGFELSKQTGSGIASESIGGYSVSYFENYPGNITNGLNVYRSLWQ